MSYDPALFRSGARALAETARELAALGHTPATSSNFSLRLDADLALITISGRDKGRLSEADFMVVDGNGQAVDSEHRPSAETLLHTQLYAHDPMIGCVLHTHSRVQTVASRLFAAAGRIELSGYELLKAFPGCTSHASQRIVPVLANQQHMPSLAAAVAPWLQEQPAPYGYLIEGHGLYAWGADLAEARRHLDAFEFLLACELDLRRLGA